MPNPKPAGHNPPPTARHPPLGEGLTKYAQLLPMTLHEPMFCRSVGGPSFSSSPFDALFQ